MLDTAWCSLILLESAWENLKLLKSLPSHSRYLNVWDALSDLMPLDTAWKHLRTIKQCQVASSIFNQKMSFPDVRSDPRRSSPDMGIYGKRLGSFNLLGGVLSHKTTKCHRYCGALGVQKTQKHKKHTNKCTRILLQTLSCSQICPNLVSNSVVIYLVWLAQFI